MKSGGSEISLDYAAHQASVRSFQRVALLVVIGWVAWSGSVLYLIWSGFFRSRYGSGDLRTISLYLGLGVAVTVVVLWLLSRRFNPIAFAAMIFVVMGLEAALLLTPIMNY